jgi:hypothetical protein
MFAADHVADVDIACGRRALRTFVQFVVNENRVAVTNG